MEKAKEAETGTRRNREEEEEEEEEEEDGEEREEGRKSVSQSSKTNPRWELARRRVSGPPHISLVRICISNQIRPSLSTGGEWGYTTPTSWVSVWQAST